MVRLITRKKIQKNTTVYKNSFITDSFIRRSLVLTTLFSDRGIQQRIRKKWLLKNASNACVKSDEVIISVDSSINIIYFFRVCLSVCLSIRLFFLLCVFICAFFCTLSLPVKIYKKISCLFACILNWLRHKIRTKYSSYYNLQTHDIGRLHFLT